MVKTPRTRHSKPQRAPVTIELTANRAASTTDEATEAPAQEPVVTAADERIILSDPVQTSEEPASAAEVSSYDRSVEDRIVEEEDLTGRQHAYDSSRQAEPAPQPAALGGSNWASHLAAGVIGGLLAAGAGWLLQPGQTQDTTAIQGVLSDVAGVRAEVEALKSAGGANADLAGAVEQLRGKLATLQSAVQAAGGGDAAAVTALNDKIAQIEASIASLSSSGGQQVDARIAAIEQSVAALTGKFDSQTAQPKIALAIAAAALKSALERGAPFAAELETFAAISPGLPQIEALRSRAQTGVASRADIAKAFPDAANAMVAAANPVPEDAGFFQRLFSSAESVVQVRPIGEVAGEEPGARVARMEVAVNAGSYDKALAEYDALPEAVKAAGASIADQIRSRAEVEKLVDQLIADAMKAV